MTPESERLNDALLQDWIDELRSTDGKWVAQQGGKLMREMFPPGYKEWLTRFHEELKPKVYLEIGVQNGSTILLANPDTTIAFGVDPVMRIGPERNCFLFQMTSDEFFQRAALFGVEMTFVDGMHNFEFALRDIMNAENVSKPSSVILVHDVLPKDAETSVRTPIEGHWTGDVWKILPILRKTRPDLTLEVIECNPSGLLVISGLKPWGLSKAEAQELYEAATTQEVIDAPFSEYERPEDLIVKEPSVLAK
jgi:hypothetical protein